MPEKKAKQLKAVTPSLSAVHLSPSHTLPPASLFFPFSSRVTARLPSS